MVTLPFKKKTGRVRTLVFSAHFRVNARTTVFPIEFQRPPALPLCQTGRDRLLEAFDGGTGNISDPFCVEFQPRGGGSNDQFVTITLPFFSITARVKSSWVEGGNAFAVPKSRFVSSIIATRSAPTPATLLNTSHTTDFFSRSPQSFEVTGTYTIEIDVEELFEIVPPTTPFTSVPIFFDDRPEHQGCYFRFTERLAAAANNVRWSIAFGSDSSSGAVTIDGGDGNPGGINSVEIPTYSTDLLAQSVGDTALNAPDSIAGQGRCQSSDCTGGVDAQVGPVVTAGWPWALPLGATSATFLADVDALAWEKTAAPSGTVSVDYLNGIHLQVDGAHGWCADDSPGVRSFWGRTRSAHVRLGPPVDINVSGVLKEFSQAYPGAVSLFTNLNPTDLFSNAGGAFAKSLSFQDLFIAGGNGFGGLNNYPGKFGMHAGNPNQTPEFFVSLNQASLTAVGEDANDIRSSFHSVAWNALTASQAASVTSDDFPDGTGWTTTGGVSVSTTAAGVLLTAGSNGSGTKTYATPLNVEGYRYLRFRVKPSRANHAYTLQIGSKKWNFLTGASGSFQDIDIDGMLPDIDQGAGPSQADSRYPCDNLASNTPTAEPQFWGVNALRSFSLTDLLTGDTLEIDSIKLFRKSFVKLGIQNPDRLLAIVPGFGPPDNLGVKRLGLGITDGRTSLEPYGKFQFGSVIEDQSIAGFIAQCNKTPGWTLTDPGDLRQGFYGNANGEACHLGGNCGWLYDNAAAAWVDYTNVDPSGGVTIKATFLFDLFSGYPGMGDPINQSGYGSFGALTLFAAHVFRGLGHGVAHTTDFKPAKNAPVICQEHLSGLFVGSATTDDQGYFETGLPYAPSDFTVVDYLVNHKFVGNANALYARKKTRIQGLFTGTGSNPWNLELRFGEFPRYHRAFINETGDVVYRTAGRDAPYGGFDTSVTVTSTGDCTVPRMAMDHRSSIQLVYIRTIAGACASYRRTSTDQGKSFGDEILGVSGATRVTNAVSDHAYIEVDFVPNAGTSGPGTLSVARKAGLGELLSAFATLVDATGVALHVADDSFNVIYSKSQGGKWILVVIIDGETTPSEWQSTDNMLSVTRVV